MTINNKNERGVALVTALFWASALLLLGTTFCLISLGESRIVHNEVSGEGAFQLAEAGIDHAKRALIPENLTAILDGTAGYGPAGTPPFGPSVSVAGGTYVVEVANNVGARFPRGDIPADPSGSATVDGDRILVVTSNASYREGSRIIEAVIRLGVPGVAAVYLMDGPDAGGPVEVEDFEPDDGARIDGIDCNPPSAGGGPGPGPHLTGIAVHSPQAESDVVVDLDTEAWGVTGVNGSGDVQQVPSAISAAELAVWVNMLIAEATAVGTGACVGPLGTWASPQICHAQGPAVLTDLIPDGSTGAGILIINDLDLVTPETDGSALRDFVYEGIVIVMGDGRFRLRGISRIYGTVIMMNILGNHSGETRIRVRDDSQICYSSLAMRNAQGVLATVLAWHEN